MIISPLENTARRGIFRWFQVRPYITQHFGQNLVDVYKKAGLKGHAGTDLRAKIGTPVYATHDGVCRIKDMGNKGYGKYIKIRSSYKLCETLYAHLDSMVVKTGEKVSQGQLIGYTGNSGNSAPHLHFGYRKLIKGTGTIFNWRVKDYSKGYWGYINIEPYTLTWKGTL